MEDEVTLGGNISLAGFSKLEGAEIVILKKIIGNYAKKFSEIASKFESLKVTMKPVHEREKSELYEIHAKMMANGGPTATEVTDRNLFVAVDSALKKIENSIN